MIIQTLFIIFSLFVILKIIFKIKNEKISIFAGSIWIVLFISIILLVLFPEIMVFLSHIAGVQRGVDLFIYASIILLFYLIFKIFILIETIQQDITKVVREMALLKHEDEKRSEKSNR